MTLLIGLIVGLKILSFENPKMMYDQMKLNEIMSIIYHPIRALILGHSF